MDLLSIALAITGFFGISLAVLGPVLLLIAVKNGSDARWVRRLGVSPCAALRPGAALPGRLSVFGRTVPGHDGLVVAPLSGAEGVWYRTVVCSIEGTDETTSVTVLWEASGGDPFGVADGTGVAAVSAGLLEGSTFARHLSVWRQTRKPVASHGPAPTRRVADETTARRRTPGPFLRQVLDRGLISADVVRRVDEVAVIEEIVPAGIPLHVIGAPATLPGGTVGLALPGTGRYLVSSRAPADTERDLAGDRRMGLGCAIWALLIGAVSLAVFAAIAISISR